MLQREPNNFVVLDIEKKNVELDQWINKMSLKKTGEEYSRESELIAKMLGQPQVMLYVDFEHPEF